MSVENAKQIIFVQVQTEFNLFVQMYASKSIIPDANLVLRTDVRNISISCKYGRENSSLIQLHIRVPCTIIYYPYQSPYIFILCSALAPTRYAYNRVTFLTKSTYICTIQYIVSPESLKNQIRNLIITYA